MKNIIVEIEYGDGVYFYLTSAPDVTAVTLASPEGNKPVGFTSSNSVPVSINKVTGSSQSIDPAKGNATIGNITIDVIDLDGAVTDYLRARLVDDLKGPRGKVARLYYYFDGTEPSATLYETQIISSVAYEPGKVVISCSDIQRELRKEIFSRLTTKTVGAFGNGGNTLRVLNPTPFGNALVQHDANWSANPNQKIGYARIVKSRDEYEIISFTGVSSTHLTGVTRGVFGTYPINNNDPDEALEVEEHVFLDMPVPMMAYALLTGKMLGTNDTLPAHWNLGVSEQFVDTASFLGIGPDLYNPDDTAAGIHFYFVGVENEDGKKFIETELFLPLGLFAIVDGLGRYSLRRCAPVVSDSPFSAVLDAKNVVRAGQVKYNAAKYYPSIIYLWNYRYDLGRTNRISKFIDATAQQIHGDSPALTITSRGIGTTWHTEDAIYQMVNGLRDRYSAPPLEMTVTVAPVRNIFAIRVGDVVRVNLPMYRDLSNDTPTTLLRSFEVQSRSVNWETGEITLNLFGSAARSNFPPPSASNAYILPDSWYSDPVGVEYNVPIGATSSATEISAANFPGTVDESTPGLTRIVADTTLDCLGNVAPLVYLRAKTFWCGQSLRIEPGVTLKIINGTCTLRIRGFFDVQGYIDSTGRAGYGPQPITINSPSKTFFLQGPYIDDAFGNPSQKYEPALVTAAYNAGQIDIIRHNDPRKDSYRDPQVSIYYGGFAWENTQSQEPYYLGEVLLNHTTVDVSKPILLNGLTNVENLLQPGDDTTYLVLDIQATAYNWYHVSPLWFDWEYRKIVDESAPDYGWAPPTYPELNKLKNTDLFPAGKRYTGSMPSPIIVWNEVTVTGFGTTASLSQLPLNISGASGPAGGLCAASVRYGQMVCEYGTFPVGELYNFPHAYTSLSSLEWFRHGFTDPNLATTWMLEGGGSIFPIEGHAFGWQVGNAGEGGEGGKGIVVVCRGMEFGPAGKVRTSGAPGGAGTRYRVNHKGTPLRGANGASGSPGGLVVAIDGHGSPPPTITSATFEAKIYAPAIDPAKLGYGHYHEGSDAFSIFGTTFNVNPDPVVTNEEPYYKVRFSYPPDNSIPIPGFTETVVEEYADGTRMPVDAIAYGTPRPDGTLDLWESRFAVVFVTKNVVTL